MRVLDLEPLESTGTVRLMESHNQQCGCYVALSYVWGTSPSLRLLAKNQKTFMDAIDIDDLPKTIRDAVRVTRALNVRYLWVDSLCILQDSDADKELQIPHMNAYYREAVAVISASGATDVHAGFLGFQSTEDEIITRAQSQFVADEPEYGPMPYSLLMSWPDDTETHTEICLIDVDPPFYSYNKEPINGRGWTLQESSLARRLLIFPVTGGIIMRCAEGEHFAGNVLGNPFHEEAGSLYHESDIIDQTGSESEKEVSGRDSETSRATDEGTKDRDDKEEEGEEEGEEEEDDDDDDAENEFHSTDEEVDESGSENKDIEYESNSEEGNGNSEQDTRSEGKRERFQTYREKDREASSSDENDWEDVDEEEGESVYDNADDSKRSINQDDDQDDENEDENENDEKRKKDLDEYYDKVMFPKTTREDEISQGWYTSVQDYTHRALSQPGDILIALGALAQQYQSLHDDVLGNYEAGLWTKRLCEGLLWHLAYPRHQDPESFIQPRKVASEYHAPSWSWASCGQPVTFRTQREPDLIPFGEIDQSHRDQPIWCIEIMGCSVMPRNEHIPFGAVQAAHIDIKGVLMPIRRVSGKVWSAYKNDRCAIDDLALLEANGCVPDYPTTDLFAPDSIEALEKIGASCHWLPVYDATRGRTRGLVVCELASGLYQRLGFAEFQVRSNFLPKLEKRVIRLI